MIFWSLLYFSCFLISNWFSLLTVLAYPQIYESYCAGKWPTKEAALRKEPHKAHLCAICDGDKRAPIIATFLNSSIFFSLFGKWLPLKNAILVFLLSSCFSATFLYFLSEISSGNDLIKLLNALWSLTSLNEYKPCASDL